MNDLKNILSIFFHRLRREEVQETLMNLGVNVFDRHGEIRDSYLILMEAISYLKILREEDRNIEFLCSIQTIIGMYYMGEFISYFIDDMEI